MRICLIAEGSYPYITGGVSSWINQLILNMADYEFIVIAITPDRSKRGQYKYPLPSNLVQMHDIFLNEIYDQSWRSKRPFTMNPGQATALKNLLLGRQQDWPTFFQYFRDWANQGVRAFDILMSENFYELIRENYEANNDELPFAQVYWTMHSMYLLIFYLLLMEYPKADIYHAVSTGYAGIIGACAADAAAAPLILTEHGIYTREREEEIIKADWVKGFFKNIWIDYFNILSRCAYANAAQVVTLFDRNREIQHQLGCPPSKSTIIHNGINFGVYEPIAAENRQRPECSEIKVGAIVRVVPIKDIKTLLLAFSIVHKKLPNVSLYILGPTDEDPDYYQECVQYLVQLELNRVYFTGNVNIRSYLGNIDILVLTSISEGQPLAILEGMASALPYVTTDVGDCRVMINGQNDSFGSAGRVVSIMDADGIADAIIDLAENYDLRRKMGEAGYQRVRSSYSFVDLIKGYREIYEKNAGRIS